MHIERTHTTQLVIQEVVNLKAYLPVNEAHYI